MNNTITLDEFTNIFKYLLENNKKLRAEGKKATAICIEGEAGIGKTSVIRDFAEQNGMTFVKLVLSQLEEISDLIGFPLKEFKIKLKNSNGELESKWVPADLLPTYLNLPCDEYELTNESRMSYAPPAWLPREDNEHGVILLLDDFSRSNSLFQQALMELINEGSYIGWTLPKNTTIALSSNPDDGNYQVTSLDAAQLSRMVRFNVEFDIKGWAKWAEMYGLDDRAINFGLSYSSEIFDTANRTINPRSYTTFCNAISGIPDWNKPESLALILNIAKGCFDDEKNVIGNLFTIFIANKLDKLISPKDLLTQNWETVKPRILNCVYDSQDHYHPEIASVLSTRLLNYSIKYLSETGNKTDVISNRLIELVDSDKMIFSEDLIFNIIKTLVVKFSQKLNKLLLNPKIRSKII